MKVYLNYNNKRWRKYEIDFQKIANAVVGSMHKESEVSIILTDDKEIHALNLKYRNIDKPTNVLSFELEDDILLGDIYISLDTVIKEAKEANISVAEHTAHMVVHGILHLLGYDHLNDKEAKVMENKEIKILQKLGIKNPYEEDEFVCNSKECCPGNKFISWLNKLNFRENSFWQYFTLAILGFITSLGFAPFHMWWASLIGIAGAYKCLTRINNVGSLFKTFVKVLPFSFVYAVSMFWWVVNSIYVVPELTQQFAIWTLPALIGIGIFGGIIFALPFVIILRIRTFPPCRAFLFASAWVVVLWLREWLLTGFPWNPIANITMPFPVVANSMSLWGALGLSFIIIGLIASLVELLSNRKNKTTYISFFVFLVLLIVGSVYGYNNIKKSDNMGNATPVIRIVQPAQSATQKATHSRADALRNAEENVKTLMRLALPESEKVDLVVFPETSYPFVIMDGDYMPISDFMNKNIVVGSQYYSGGKMYNSMLISSENGGIDKIYSKSHLVPFGEYRPLGDIIPTPGQLASGQGAEIISLELNGRTLSFAPAICYEIIFSDSLVPRQTQPDAIINITNDTWFGRTPGTYQHLDMVRRYAIESGLPIIRANYSGISAFVSASGQIISALPIAQAGILDGFVWGAHMTPYRFIGRDGWMIVILLFSCICTISLYTIEKKCKY